MLFLIRVILPIILELARKSGMINMVEEEIIKFGMSLKRYNEPEDFPLPLPATKTPNNLQPQKVK